VGCLTERELALEPVEISGPDAGCPPRFVFCADVDQALALEHDIDVINLFAGGAKTLCEADGGP
jgi:hypothetical protein